MHCLVWKFKIWNCIQKQYLAQGVDTHTLGVKQYGSSPYCTLPSSVQQYIAILQYVTLQAKTSLVHTSEIDTLEDHNSS